MQKRTLFTVTSSGIASNCREGGHTPDQTRGGGELGNEHPGTKKFQGSAHVLNAPPPLPPARPLVMSYGACLDFPSLQPRLCGTADDAVPPPNCFCGPGLSKCPFETL